MATIVNRKSQNMPDEKPLFIPLRTEWYRQFDAGTKDTEYRAYGPRWNEKTCRIGRPATVSHGYGKRERLQKTVVGFKKIRWALAPMAACEIYPNSDFIAAIELR